MTKRRKAKRRPEKGPPPKGRHAGAGPSEPRGRLRQRLATAALVAAVVCLVGVSVFFKLSGSGQPSEEPSEELTAVIVDELSLTAPNSTFVQEATDILEQAGYTVDYFGGGEATVEFYRELPKRGHDFVIFRTHAARLRDEQKAMTDDAGLFTSDLYDKTRYVEEQRADRLRPSYYLEDPEGSAYFGITPKFVESSMKGTFDDAMVIIMGCDGLRSDRLAEAFVGRGAQAVVSWDGLVSSTHTDAATEYLLRRLVEDRLPVGAAVAQTMAEIGPDPVERSKLLFYPRESLAGGPREAYLAR